LRRNTETRCIGVPVPSQNSERSCTCVSGIDLTSFYGFEIWFLELFRQCGVFCFSL